MNWKVGSVIVAALLLLETQGYVEGAPPASRGAALTDYQRPSTIPFPDSDPYSEAKSVLGRRLFFDPVFSNSRTISCATCHNPTLSWGDGRARAHGEGAGDLAFRSPTLLDVAWMPRLGWDGKFRDLESVAFAPITASGNMNLKEETLIARLAAEPSFVAAFADAFSDGAISRRNIEQALATYERGIVSPEAPFDRWARGDENAIDEAAKRGFDLFNAKAHCSGCHGGWTFSDGSFHDIGTAEGKDIGRGRLFATSIKLQYAFKTPTLRDATRRAPYMHDGSVPTLEAVIDLYNRGGIARPSRSELIRPLGLTDGEKSDLIAFLQTLTSDRPPSGQPAPAR
jgi:cytochrome c peroxidase